MSDDARHFLVVSHTGRAAALEATADVCGQLAEAGAVPVVAHEQWHDVLSALPELEGVVKRFEEVSPRHLELVIVLGGDGTILRAAELTREHPVPLLGVNLGHVGFLAESERDDLGYTVGRALARDYTVEERMTLSVRAKVGDEVVYESWALNEATVEKAERERMLEVVVEVDRRPLSSFGCDGIVMSTPTGSTAYSFSADCENTVVQRILVRHGFGRDEASLLMDDYRSAIAHFGSHPITVPISEEEAGGFHH